MRKLKSKKKVGGFCPQHNRKIYRKELFLLSLNFLHLHCTNLQWQSEQIDKSVSIMMVIQITCSEACKRFTVQRIRRCLAGTDDISLVKSEFDFTGHILLRYIDKCLDCFTKWCEPFSFVYDLCELASKFFLASIVSRSRIKFFKLFVSCHQDRSARSFIDTTGFHSNNTVLNDINDTDSMLSAKFVQLCDDLRNFHFFSVDGLRNTGFKSHGNLFIFIRSFLRSTA